MVVFTCNHCGDSVQKPKVEKHYDTKCRRPKDLTCVDCLKDFRGEEFAIHTSCVTEDQRYSAKGTEVKPLKGLKKQESWVDIVQACYDTEPDCKNPKLAAVFKGILGQTNVPRKKPRFLNFIASTMGSRINKDDAAETFDLIQKYYMKQQEIVKAEKANENTENVKETEEDAATDKKMTKKRKVSENQDVEEVESPEITEESKNKKKGKQQNEGIVKTVQPQENGKSKKRKNKQSEPKVDVENNNEQKPENGESSPKKAKLKETETLAVNSEAESPIKKKKNKKRNKKNKQQNGVNDIVPVKSDSPAKNNKDKQNVVNSTDVSVIANSDSSSNVENGIDKGIVTKAMNKRQRLKRKALKAIGQENGTDVGIENPQTALKKSSDKEIDGNDQQEKKIKKKKNKKAKKVSTEVTV